ncbi:probable asparagine--tRNA ligase, mitochondrial isoform X2 [Pollicipes pollicipes]|uniref:probable asparagine--tRNA ligase, mitochondrial isoform X2 n=1 Tax=Pollicipes pollicipes TaxID=41117 RepID=UPI001884DF09|nr:probable asparagine--tRNA ligase, mitochondrial isoform X2 [Pollicipes pollicipes]
MVTWTRACAYLRKSVQNALLSPDQSQVTVQGWLQSVRLQKNYVFASLSDGLGPETLQLVFKPSPDAKGLNVNSFVQVSGDLVLTPGRKQPAELKCHKIDIIRPCPADGYPFPARSRPTWQQARQHVHLRSRLPHVAALLRTRAAVTRALHEHMERRGYVHVHTPAITANDCEGAGDVFTVVAPKQATCEAEEERRPFFGEDVHLTVSGQLHLEAISSGITHVYSLSPAFRAESSRTRRHLAEFHMLEAELAPVQRLPELTDALQELTQDVAATFLDRSGRELELILPDAWREQLASVERLISAPFAQLTHAEAVSVLQRRREPGAPAAPGGELSRQHELALLEHCGQTPVFVTDWPARLKPFYVRTEGDTAAAVDVLVPRIGELAGGSLREDDPARLTARLHGLGLLPRLDWYAQLRRFGGPPTAGYGLGLERLLLLLTGLESVRDVVPFPRWWQHCDT